MTMSYFSLICTPDSTLQRLEGLKIVTSREKPLVHRQTVLTPLIHVCDPRLLSVDDPAAVVLEDPIEVEHALRARGHERVAVMFVQRPFGLTPLFDRERADHEVREVAPGAALAYELPVEPDPFIVRPPVAVAEMAISVNDAARPGLRLLESIQGLVGSDETLRIVEHPLRNDFAKFWIRHIDLGVFPHDLELVAVHRRLHRRRQPFLLLELRTSPPSPVQTRESFEGARDPIDARVLQALTELSVLQRKIFHDDQALPNLWIPIGVVASGRGDVQ